MVKTEIKTEVKTEVKGEYFDGTELNPEMYEP